MEGVPYIVVSAVDGGSGIIWDVSKAGEPVAEGVLSGELTVAQGGSGYNNTTAGQVTGVELVSELGNGRGGVVTIEVDSNGTVTKATVTSPGSGYKSGDILRISSPNGGGTDARFWRSPPLPLVQCAETAPRVHYVLPTVRFPNRLWSSVSFSVWTCPVTSWTLPPSLAL